MNKHTLAEAPDARNNTQSAVVIAPDPLGCAIGAMRPTISDRARPVAERVGLFWAAAKHARDFATWDQHESEFIRLGWETGLAAALGRHADEELRHVISWARRGLNPFSHGPLK
jgi:hypothetical protein